MNCPNCNTPLKPGAKFCTRCGLLVSQTPINIPVMTNCPYCGMNVLQGAFFCSNCGAKIKTVPSASKYTPLVVPSQPQTPQVKQIQESISQVLPIQPSPPLQPVITQTHPPISPEHTPPLEQFRTNRGLFKTFIFSLLTFGIYLIVMFCHMSEELNVTCRHDGKHTLHYLAAFGLGIITCGLYLFVYLHKVYGRVHDELNYRGIDYECSPSDFWLWGVLGSLLFFIGPLIAEHKLLKAMNLINAHYNRFGS